MRRGNIQYFRFSSKRVEAENVCSCPLTWSLAYRSADNRFPPVLTNMLADCALEH